MLTKAERNHITDQLKFAREGADNLAKRSGYEWTDWLKGATGKTTASFIRDERRWSLSFYWTPAEELGELAKRIEKMDHHMRVAMNNFGALKLGAMAREMHDSGVGGNA